MSDDRNVTREGERWAGVKTLLNAERLMLGPYFSYIARNTPRRMLHLLSYYKFAAKMIGPGKRVLEVGCSEGFGSMLLAESATEVLAIDLDAEAIAVANATVATEKLRFAVADVLADTLGRFDAAVSLDVIEHIYPDHEDAFVAAIAAALHDHGVLIVGTPNIVSDQFASAVSREGHVNLFSAERLSELMLQHFHNVFSFSGNDEMVHTGFSKLAHYLLVVCVDPRRAPDGNVAT
jgi:2-polyprenyl-3-methyl-5-hydroxy-6-metoxy-1,4-benzoquinol methylase